jgi:hypothetical protein
MSYELWDTDSGNRLAVFRTQASAVRHVRSVLKEFGTSGLDGLSVGHYDAASGRTRRVASGRRLARWAEPPAVAVRGRSQASRPKQPV